MEYKYCRKATPHQQIRGMDMTFEEKLSIIEPMLSLYQYDCLLDCYSGFGFNEKTLDTLLYVWFGMESEAFINTYCKG